jgi:hypothetical protein
MILFDMAARLLLVVGIHSFINLAKRRHIFRFLLVVYISLPQGKPIACCTSNRSVPHGVSRTFTVAFGHQSSPQKCWMAPNLEIPDKIMS